MSITDLRPLHPAPEADPRFVVQGSCWRITVLTSRMLRLEYSAAGQFEDRPTRLALCRRFDTPEFTQYAENGRLHIETEYLHLQYDMQPFSAEGLQVDVGGSVHWNFTTADFRKQGRHNLGGTARTLDGTDGATPLSNGLLNRRGLPVALDDSKTLAIPEDGWPVPGLAEHSDFYFFGYNMDFEACIRDFYKLTGATPLLPRWTLGNWWSRYHKYTDPEYRALMDRFAEKKVPLSCAVIDMDWHLVDIPEKWGTGWTGYTWNREFFPDAADFLKNLHDRGLHTTLNLHPRDGIRAFEAVYPALCQRLGRPADSRTIAFDVADRKFMEAYFDTVLNPMEDGGVDFWWLDWQQSGGFTRAGYDTLWMLNHCHWLDSARGGKRPLTFSRYAEIGSHRYPLGFSGDTAVTWDSLDFQPYFTSTASNVGFSWWSHDIGGHMSIKGRGQHDYDLETRWVQYGVFSPILRLHSTANIFNSKEPWNYGPEAEPIQEDFLRLRHRLVPYIYSMMVRNHEDGIPMIRPMYHVYPKKGEAYGVKNEYFFGSELIAAPITSPRDTESMLSTVQVWLPAGVYVDVFSGRIYTGDRNLTACRPLETIPVFAKAGGIVPLAAESAENTTDNPEALDVYVFGGADGSFTMTEDNGGFEDSLETCRTRFTFRWGKESVLEIAAPDTCAYVPENRRCTLHAMAFEKPEKVLLDGAELPFRYDERRHEIVTDSFPVLPGKARTLTVCGSGRLPENEIVQSAYDIIQNAQSNYSEKLSLFGIMEKSASAASKVSELLAGDFQPNLTAALCELLLAKTE